MAAEEKSPSVQEQASAPESKKMNCKFCKKEVFKTKIVMHITRNKNCKSYYGSELDTIKEIQNAESKKISCYEISNFKHDRGHGVKEIIDRL